MEERPSLTRRHGNDVISAELRLFPVLLRSEQGKWFSSLAHLRNEDRGRWFLRSLLAPPFLTPLSWRCSKLGLDTFGTNPYPDGKYSFAFGPFGPKTCCWKMGRLFCGPCSLAPSCGSGILFAVTAQGGEEKQASLLWWPNVRTSPPLFTYCTYNLSSGPRKLNPT